MGWGKSIALNHDFIGREALAKKLANPRRKVVTLEFDRDEVLRVYSSLFKEGDAYRQFELPDIPYQVAWTDLILKGGKTIGHSTHPGNSCFFRKMLALSFVDVEHSESGTRVAVLWGNPNEPQTELQATVVPAPYKRSALPHRRCETIRACPS